MRALLPSRQGGSKLRGRKRKAGAEALLKREVLEPQPPAAKLAAMTAPPAAEL